MSAQYGLSMRHVSNKMQCLFMAATVFLCPLLVVADSACRCPDCARRICTVKSEAGAYADCSERTTSCCCQGDALSQQSHAPAEPTQAANPVAPQHQASGESKGCHCNAYIYTHGNAILPLAQANTSLAPEAFHQPAPKSALTSGWVYQILHPPRPFNA